MVLRKRRADRGGCVDDIEWNSIPDLHFLNNPEAALFQNERRRAVREAVQSLPTILRGVMKVRYEDDLNIAEIAIAMGLTESATKTRLDRGRRALTDRLSKFVLQTRHTNTSY
jgi:DNA-directed RNA polymerase specialized sigma24 family protein